MSVAAQNDGSLTASVTYRKYASADQMNSESAANEDKITFALRNGIAVWDVLAGCDIKGADDSSIRNPQPNDMSRILECADIKAIFTTGTKAFQLYKKFCYPKTGIMAIGLPSTSPYEQLYEAYFEIRKYLE